MPKQKPLSDDELAQLRRLLNAMDADDNGAITFGVMDTEADEPEEEEDAEEESDDAEDTEDEAEEEDDAEEESEDEEDDEEEEDEKPAKAKKGKKAAAKDEDEEEEDDAEDEDEEEEEAEADDEEDPRDEARELLKKLISGKDEATAKAVLKKYSPTGKLPDVPEAKLPKLVAAVKAALKA